MQKIKEGGKFLDLPVLDHLVITTEGYYSFADEGFFKGENPHFWH